MVKKAKNTKSKNEKGWSNVYTRKLEPFTAAIYAKAFAEKVPHKLVFPKNSQHALHFKSDHLDKLTKNYFKFLKSFKLDDYAKIYKQEVDKFSDWLKEKKGIELKSLSDSELAEVIEKTEARISSFIEEQLYTHLALQQTSKETHPDIKKTFPDLKKASKKNDRGTNTLIKSIWSEAAKRTGKKVSEIKLLLPEEIVKMLRNGKKVSGNEIAKRKRAFAAEFNKGKVKIHSGTQAVKNLQKRLT